MANGPCHAWQSLENQSNRARKRLNFKIMKKLFFTLGALLVVATLVFVGCSKSKEATVNKFITVQDGTLVVKDMPTASSDVDIEVTMNKKVIPGGSSIVNVDSPVTVQKVYVGVENEFGYYEWIPTGTTYEFVIHVNQDIVLAEDEDEFVVLVSILDSNGKVSEVEEKSVELIDVGTGMLQISLSFDNAKDVDLHVIEPEQVDENGDSLSYYSRHIYYGHRTSYNGGHLDLDSNPGCSIDNINNENVTYEDEAYVAPGLYTVYAVMYSNCDPSVATNYVVSAYYGGALLKTVTGTFPVDAPSTGSNLTIVEPAMTFVIPNRGQFRTKTFAPEPLTESAMEKMSME